MKNLLSIAIISILGNALAKEDKAFADVVECADSALWEWAKID